jgi:ribosomal protein S18 acetylase RimI-like enzyme
MSECVVRSGAVVQRRPATTGDIPLLRDLFADARVELSVLPPDTRDVIVDMQFRAQRRAQAAQHPAADHDIVMADGVVVGQVVVDHSGEAAHVVDLSIGLSHRREGIAMSVLCEIADAARAAGQRVWLTVWSGNAAARGLCERAGFRVCAEEGGYVTMERKVTADA